jgi:hypothetical protein
MPVEDRKSEKSELFRPSLIAFAVQFFHPRKIKEMISNPRGRARMKKEPGGRLPVLVLII